MSIIGVAVIALTIILFSLVSDRLKDTPLTAPMVFAAIGLLIGQGGVSMVNFDFSHGVVHTLAEATLVLVLFSDAARIDLSKLRHDHNLPIRMLLVGMPLIIVLGAAAALLLPLGLTVWEAALLAAMLAPTDAALGQAVVSNPAVPERIRQALNIESGLNDGIALPVVLLFACAASIVGADATQQQDWLVFGLKQICLGPVAGIAIGLAGGWLIDRAAIKGWMTESFEGPAILGLALLAFTGAEAIGGNGFIAAFTAGLLFGNQVRGRCAFVFEFAESEGQLLTLLTFLIFGASILPEFFHGIGWQHLGYALLSLTVIRMLPIALSLSGSGLNIRTKLFLGWFGPRGLASMLFALLVLQETAAGNQATLMMVTVLTVALSVVLHGLSAAPLARAYGRQAGKVAECPEMKAVHALPLRINWKRDAKKATEP